MDAVMKPSTLVLAVLAAAAPCALLAAGADPAAPPGAASGAAPARAAAPAKAPAKIHQSFDIVRKDDKIGDNVVDIDRQGDAVTAKCKTDISVKLMYVEVYRYQHQASESWKGGQLAAFKSQTNDNGTKHVIEIAPSAAPDKLTLIVDGVKSEEPKSIAPASLWSRDLVTRTELFDPADGKRYTVKVSDLGDETLTIQGAKRQTRHFRLAARPPADFDRDLWFEGDLLVRMKMQGSDHSTIVSDLVKSSNGT
jgi:uncharacterized protein (DUF2147 family)